MFAPEGKRKRYSNITLRLRRMLGMVVSSYALVWLLSIGLFISLVILLYYYYPRPIKIEGMSQDIALITQILSIVIGIGLIGVTIYLSSYGSPDRLSAQLKDIEALAEPFFERFFAGGQRKNKVRNSKFRKYLFHSVKIKRLIFKDSAKKEYPNYFVLRPYWNGVWYQVSDSPFKKSVEEKGNLNCIAILHELVICARAVLGVVYELRKSGTSLLSKNTGTQGSKWFLEEFKKRGGEFDALNYGQVPDEISQEEGLEMVWLAVYSAHYMREELRDYSEELNWEPFKLSQFQLFFLDYFLWVSYLVDKFQLLRIARVEMRFPSISTKFSDKTKKNLFTDELGDTKQKVFDVRKKAIAEFGVSKHYRELKKSSIPGIGLSAFVLVAIVVLWPFKEVIGCEERTLYLFSLLYAAGVSAILHGVFFMYRLLWERKSSLGRWPMYPGD